MERVDAVQAGAVGREFAGEAAVELAGTTDADKIIEAVEKEPLAWETPEGWKIMQAADHSVVEDCLWGQTAYNQKYGFAIPASFESIQGEEIGRTAQELITVRSEYEKRAK